MHAICNGCKSSKKSSFFPVSCLFPPYCLSTLSHQKRNQVPGDGYRNAPCAANCCAAEMIRGMIDCYTPLGEVRTSSKDIKGNATGSGGEVGDCGEPGAEMAGGLPRLGQVCGIHRSDYFPPLAINSNRPYRFHLSRLPPLYRKYSSPVSSISA